MNFDGWMCQPIGYDLRQFREELRSWPVEDLWRAERELQEREQARVKLRLVRAEIRYRTPPQAVRQCVDRWILVDRLHMRLFWLVDGNIGQLHEVTYMPEVGPPRTRKVWESADAARLAHVARWLAANGWPEACRELRRVMPGMGEYLGDAS